MMEDDIIQSFRDEIKNFNENHKTDKTNQVKGGIYIFSTWMQVLLWGLFIVLVSSLIGFTALIGINPENILSNKRVGISLLISAISGAAIVILKSIFEKLYTKENLDTSIKKLNILKSVIGGIYSEKDLSHKVKSLIDIYRDELEEIEEHESKRNKFFASGYAILGTIAVTSFNGMDKIGIGFDGWLVILLCLGMFGLVAAIPLYLSTTITPKKDKYKAMLKRLKHLHIMLMEEEKDKIDSVKRTAPKKKK